MGAKERKIFIKNRPICIASSFYIVGILIGLYLKISIVFYICFFILITYFIFIFILKKSSTKFIIYFGILIFGIFYISSLESNYNNIYEKIEGEKIIKAVIISEPEDDEYKYSYTIKIESIKNIDNTNNIEYLNCIGKKLILDIKKKYLKNFPEFGDKVILKGNIEIPNISRNYKGFDYRQYLKTKKIYGIVQAENINKVKENCVNVIDKFVNYVQNNIKDLLKQILTKDELSLCIGILIGDRTNISEEIENNFKKSNLTHMLAVSGSHIAYIINCFAILLGRTNKKMSKIITIIFLIFFMFLTGFTSSVLRASFMGILVLLSSILYRKPDTLNNLGISSLIILLINPYTIFDIGFVLSFAGTLGIILFSDLIINYIHTKIIDNVINQKDNKNSILLKVFNSRIFKYLLNSFSITLSANLLIIPIMAYSFSTFSFTFLISNILAGPVMEIVTIFGFLVYFISIIFLPLAKFLGIFLNLLLFILLKIAELSSMIPGSMVYIKTPYLFYCIFYYIYIFIIYYKNTHEDRNSKKLSKILRLYRKINIKIIALFLIFILLFKSGSYFIIPSSLKLYFIDVGQGDSTLIQTPFRKNILVDGGGSEFGNFDVGKSILLPYLLDRRITNIDYLIISHFDSDHVKGLFAILENLKVNNIIISKQGEDSNNFKEFIEIIKDKNIRLIIVKKGDLLKIDKLTFIEILFPEEKLITNNILNNNSIVFKLISNKFSILFTGDIEKVAEEKLVELYKTTNKLNSDVLKVAHHGSKTSSITNFLEEVKPKVALIGVGKDNKFGHPDKSTINSLNKYTKNIFRTDQMGEIIINFNGKKINIETHIRKK